MKWGDLTEQDQQLLRLVAEGLGDKEIAFKLGLSCTTVRSYNSRIFKKLGVRSRVQAAWFVWEQKCTE